MAWKNLRDNNGKAALYMLLGQAEWILRRTETVSFLNGGNTRRSISFDCMLPGDDAKWLRWIPDTHDSQTEPRYVGLPVTFLGKSDLINLDVRDGNGAVLHTVGRRDNGDVLNAGLRGCFTSLSAIDDLGNLGDFLQFQLSMLGLKELKSLLDPTTNDAEAGSKVRKHFLAAMGAIFYGCKQYYDGHRAVQTETAKTLLETAGEIVSRRPEDIHPEQDMEPLHFTEQQAARAIIDSEWHGVAHADSSRGHLRDLDYQAVHDLGFDWSEGPDRTPASAANVGEARELDDARKNAIVRIMHGDGKEHKVYQEPAPDTLERIEFWDKCYGDSSSDGFAQNLAESDWAVRALLRFLDIWRQEPKGKAEYNAMQSYLLLISSACDTYPLVVLIPIEHAEDRQRLMVKISFDAGYREDVFNTLVPFNQTINLSFQTFGARSTHIEVAPAENVVLTDVAEVCAPDESEKTGEESEAHKTVHGFHGLRKDKTLSRHLSARVAADRLHVSAGAHDKWPLTHLRLSVMMRRSYIASFLLWSLLLLVLDIGLVCVIGAPGQAGLANDPGISGQILSFFSAQNILAILALVYTLWVARRIGTMQHRVVEGLNSSMTGLLNTDLLIFTVLALVASAGMKAGDNGGDDIVSGMWPSGWKIVCVIGAVVAAVIALIAIIEFMQYWMRSTKSDGVYPLRIHYSRANRKESASPRGKRQDAIMPADRAAFSALETCSVKQRQRALTAVRYFLRSLDGRQ